MEKILRQCYKERKIISVNSIVCQSRIKSIESILENGILDKSEWKILTNWLLREESKDVEDILLKLEEVFCQEDTNFTIEQNAKELPILVGILIYKYSKNEENYLLPMMIICEYHSGDRELGDCLYQLFLRYIDEMRLLMRHPEYVEKRNYSIGTNQLRKSITEKKKKLEEDGTSFSYTVTEIDSIVSLLEKCENNFNYILTFYKTVI